jgi:hypothetical protein
MTLVVAGNSALETVRTAASLPFEAFEFAVYEEGRPTTTGYIK